MSLQLLNLEIIVHYFTHIVNPDKQDYEIPEFLWWHKATERFFPVSPLHILIRTHVKVNPASLKLTFTSDSQLR